MTKTSLARSSNWVFVTGILLFLAYSAWMAGPYLRSVFVRNAAVTSWAQIAAAPIAGKIESDMPTAGSVIGADNQVAIIRNRRLFQEDSQVGEQEHQIELARNRVSEIEELIGHLKDIETERSTRRRNYARVFRNRLESEIASVRQELSTRAEQITLLNSLLTRLKSAARNDAVPQTRLDETQLGLSKVVQQQESQQAVLSRDAERLAAAQEGIFSEADGSVPAWAQDDGNDLKLREFQLTMQLHEARANFRLIEAELKAAKSNLKYLSEAIVSVPAGSTVLSVGRRKGAIVSSGDTLLRWVDCSIILIDVPVSDAELPLILDGMKATVIIEGETRPLEAFVILTRGSAATLGERDLAAVAKGRGSETAQVILDLDSSAFTDGYCPVGRAAYVEFPDVGLLDVIRARLRI